LNLTGCFNFDHNLNVIFLELERLMKFSEWLLRIQTNSFTTLQKIWLGEFETFWTE